MTNDDDFDLEFEFEEDEPLDFIPVELHSFGEDGPFQRCVDCDKELYENGDRYMIQKSMHRGEVIFEFALCLDCHDQLLRGFSKETTERLNQYFQALDTQTLPTMEHCIDCKEPRNQQGSYNMAASCIGPFLESSYMICDKCQENIHPLISEQTRKTRDDWVGQNFPCAPESRDLVPDSPLMF